MAKLSESRVVIRFVFGKGLVKARQRYENTTRSIFRNVALQYADGMYDQMRKDLQNRVEVDVRNELIHMALLFRRHITGASGTTTTPSGNLTTVSKGPNQPVAVPLAEMLPPWAPRNAEYLRWKRKRTGGIGWFDNQNLNKYRSKAGTAGKTEGGYLFDNMRADTWETMFGPINVRFYRMRKPQENAPIANINTGTNKKNMKIQIGTIQVRALGEITPGMLPGFTSGTIRASTSGNRQLMELIYKHDRDLALRLGKMNNGVYRPTLEPFLGFFLTRALPHAVNERLRKGGFGTLFK